MFEQHVTIPMDLWRAILAGGKVISAPGYIILVQKSGEACVYSRNPVRKVPTSKVPEQIKIQYKLAKELGSTRLFAEGA